MTINKKMLSGMSESIGFNPAKSLLNDESGILMKM
jgi:hypothetical protein